MGRVPREVVLGGALVLCALMALIFPALGAFGAALVGIAAHRAGLPRLAGFALGVCLLGLALVALVAL